MHAANGVRIATAEGRLESILLRATYTAEHEAGIDDLWRDLGCRPGNPPGLASRIPAPAALTARTCSLHEGRRDEEFFVEDVGRGGRHRTRRVRQTGEYLALCLGRDHDHDCPERVAAQISNIGRRFKPGDLIAGAWDARDCLIVGYGDGRDHVRDLHEGLLAGDVAIWVARPGETPTREAGLCLARISRLPADRVTAVRDADEERAKLEAAAALTGVKENLARATERFPFPFLSPFACLILAPAWQPQTHVSAHPVRFWVVPLSKTARTGWYDVEQIEAWIAGQATTEGVREEGGSVELPHQTPGRSPA